MTCPHSSAGVTKSRTVRRPGSVSDRLELEQRLEHEAPLAQARVRNREPRLVDRLVAVEQEVEIDRPRARSASSRAGLAAELVLDLEQPSRSPRGGSSVSTSTTPFRKRGWSS